MKNKDIPLIRAAVAEPLLLAAKSIGTPVEKVIHKAGLPMQMQDLPHMLVPEMLAWQLVNIIYRMEGEPLFGLKAAMELTIQDFETVKPLLQGCVNLKSLLERFISIVPTQTNMARYTLIECGDYVWFSQQGPRLIDDYQQIELFEIAGMIQLVQLIAGARWRPSEIHFSFNYDWHVYNSEYLNPANIFFSKPYPSIAIPRRLLAMDIPAQSNLDDTEKDSAIPVTFSEQLLNAITPYIGEEKLNASLLTDISGINFRTMQRNLSQENTSYTKILDQARFRKSQFLLKKTDEKLLDISLMLGYANASAFSRAFKQWSGITPVEFRKLNINIRVHYYPFNYLI